MTSVSTTNRPPRDARPHYPDCPDLPSSSPSCSGTAPSPCPTKDAMSRSRAKWWLTGDYLTPRLNGVKYFEKPVLFYWLEAFSIKLFGLSEFTLRLWPALFALFGCLAVVWCRQHGCIGRRTGLLRAAVLATSVLYYALSRAIILDMPVSILLTTALLSFLLGTHEAPGLKRRLYLMGFLCLCRAGGPDQGPDRHPHPRHGDRRLDRAPGTNGACSGRMYLPRALPCSCSLPRPGTSWWAGPTPSSSSSISSTSTSSAILTKVHGRYQPVWYFIPVAAGRAVPLELPSCSRRSSTASLRPGANVRSIGMRSFLMLWAGLVFPLFLGIEFEARALHPAGLSAAGASDRTIPCGGLGQP